MATGIPETQPTKLGPWTGHDDYASPGSPRVRNSLNVVFESPHAGGHALIRRRPGRVGWLNQFTTPVRRVANLVPFVSRTGAREVIAWLDPATSSGTDALLYRHDGLNLEGSPLSLPAALARQRPGGSIPHIQYLGHLLFLDSFGRLSAYDGQEIFPVEAMQGRNSEITGDVFLSAPPTGEFLLEWRNRVVVAGGEDSPLTVGLSASAGSPDIPATARLGGPNVWPVATNFDVQTDEGDRITGALNLNDRLMITTLRTTTIVDEDAISPIARVKARHAGCVAPRTLVSIGSHAVFLGDRRIFRFDGEAATPISQRVERILREWVNWDAIAGAVAVNWGSRREYRIWLPVVGDGENRNRLCLIWDYAKDEWRVWSGWYLFDRSTRRGAANHYDVTCATTHLLGDSEEILLTGTSDSTVFMEDVGDVDWKGTTASVPPAYVELPELEDSAAVHTFRDVRVDCLHDGAFVEAVMVTDGRDVEQEIVRVLDGGLVENPDVDDIPYVKERALKTNQQTWPSVTAWPMNVIGPVVDELKLGVGQRGRKAKLAIVMPGQQDGVIDSARGGISRVEMLVRRRDGRR